MDQLGLAFPTRSGLQLLTPAEQFAYASEFRFLDCAEGEDQTIYLVLNDFGSLGRAYCEASEDRSDLETTISDLISGQYDNPVRVVAFKTSESWSGDVSEDIAREGCRAAALDCQHHLQPVEADMAGIGLTPCRTTVAENIRNLQSRARHARRAKRAGRL